MKKNWFKKAAAVTLTAGIALTSMAGCGSSAKNPDAATTDAAADASTEDGGTEEFDVTAYHYTGDTIKIVLGDIPSCFPFGVAYEKGFLDQVFEGDNVEFELNIIQGTGATVAQALAADEADFGMLGEQPAMSGIAADYGIIIIGKNQNSVSGYPVIAAADSGIETVADLKGKKVGVVFGTSLHYLLLSYLEAEGLSENDVELINSSDISTLLLSGELDACLTTVSQAVALEAEGAYTICDESDYGITQEGVIAARTEFVEQYPELTAKFLYAIHLADEWIRENRDEACQIAAERAQYGLAYEEAQYDSNNIEVALNDADITALSEILQFLKDQELIADNSITVDDVVDLTYLRLAGLQ